MRAFSLYVILTIIFAPGTLPVIFFGPHTWFMLLIAAVTVLLGTLYAWILLRPLYKTTEWHMTRKGTAVGMLVLLAIVVTFDLILFTRPIGRTGLTLLLAGLSVSLLLISLGGAMVTLYWEHIQEKFVYVKIGRHGQIVHYSEKWLSEGLVRR